MTIQNNGTLVAEEGETAVDVARSFFPGAIGSEDTLKRVAKAIEKRGFNDDNTLFAQSVCPDEINHEEGDITNLLATYLGEVFHLGGLAGIPFPGKTGFAAFSHHVPDDGHCFVLMAPHIGISNSKQLGMYSRDFQSCDGTACGAAIGAFKHCCAGKPLPDLATCYSDYQMAYIINQVNKCKDVVLAKKSENEQQAELATQMWKIGKNMLDEIISTDFGTSKSKLVVLTGIQINMPREYEDYFQPLSFEIFSKDGKVVDLMSEAFTDGSVGKTVVDLNNLSILENDTKKEEVYCEDDTNITSVRSC